MTEADPTKAWFASGCLTDAGTTLQWEGEWKKESQGKL